MGLEAFWNIPLRFACLIDEGFFWYTPQVPDYQISELLDVRLKGLCCMYFCKIRVINVEVMPYLDLSDKSIFR